MTGRCRALAGAALLALSAWASAEPVLSLREIRSARLVMQRWDTSCGAAALATVLTFDLADPVSETAVASAMLRTTDALRVKARGGFSLLDMKRFAQGRGYAATGYRDLTLSQLAVLKAAIVPIHQFGYPHFVVVRGVADGEVRLADPAFGNRRMPVEEFLQAWKGGVGFVVSRPGA